MAKQFSRRHALKSSLAWAGAAVLINSDRAYGFVSANERPTIAAVGTGSRWCQKATGRNGPYGSAPTMKRYADYVAVCDADANRVGLAKGLVKEWTGYDAKVTDEYRTLLDDDKIDIIHISTPDHWHAKIAIEAMKAGKDVYCEKPMTLTIEEGQQMCKVCKETGAIVQIGTQQRSGNQFIKAIAMLQNGRIGDIKKVSCSIGGAPTSPKLPVGEVPKGLDWNRWLGPAPDVAFRYQPGAKNETKSWSRGHYEFRWWYEYSGGKLTDWGAHHVDIATWGMNKTDTGPVTVEPLMVKHPVEFKGGYPVDDSQYNTATAFLLKATYADGVELEIRHDNGNGILFEGTKGRIFVNRGRLTGKPVEELKSNPLPDGALEKAYKNRALTDHFRNFVEAVAARKEPISDVFSHHRALSTCHLAGIAARLNRTIKWNPKTESVVDDPLAQSFVSRERRKGYEIDA